MDAEQVTPTPFKMETQPLPISSTYIQEKKFSRKVIIVNILGILGLLLLIIFRLERRLLLISFSSSSFALIGSFLGIWYIVSFLFNTEKLNQKEKLVLIIGTIFSLVAFALGEFGMMVVFWFPGVLISNVSYRIILLILNKTSEVAMGGLKDKITKMEEKLKKKQQ